MAQKLSILFYRKMKKMGQDGLVPLYLRITIDGDDDEMSTGKRVDPNLWLQKKQKCKGSGAQAEAINSYVRQTAGFLDRNFTTMSLEKQVTPEMMLGLLEKVDPVKRKNSEEKRIAYHEKVNEFIEGIYALKKQEKKLKHINRSHRLWVQYDADLEAYKKKLDEFESDSFEFVDDETPDRTLLDAIQEFIYTFIRRILAGEVTFSTLKRWNVVKNKITAFLPHRYQKEDILLKQLKPKHYNDLKEYLRFHDNIENNAAHKYIKQVKQILGRAVLNEWIMKNPFQSFVCKYVDPEKLPLTLLEIGRIMRKVFSTSRLEEVRDILIFCCFTGFAYNEVFELTKDDLEFGIDQRYWIDVDRGKTGRRVMVPLLPVAVDIILKYINNPYCIAYKKLLPVNSNQKFNEYLKEVGDLCGISFEITTHTARRTFATTVALENGVPIKIVSIMLGHKTIRTTEIYIKHSKRALAIHIRSLEDQLFDEDGYYIFAKGETGSAYEHLTIPPPKYKGRKIQLGKVV